MGGISRVSGEFPRGMPRERSTQLGGWIQRQVQREANGPAANQGGRRGVGRMFRGAVRRGVARGFRAIRSHLGIWRVKVLRDLFPNAR